jgi:hypothetical protein
MRQEVEVMNIEIIIGIIDTVAITVAFHSICHTALCVTLMNRLMFYAHICLFLPFSAVSFILALRFRHVPIQIFHIPLQKLPPSAACTYMLPLSRFQITCHTTSEVTHEMSQYQARLFSPPCQPLAFTNLALTEHGSPEMS